MTAKARLSAKTGWYPPGTHPVRQGWYERAFSDGNLCQWWDGMLWLIDEGGEPHWRQVNDYPHWRGSTERIERRQGERRKRDERRLTRGERG